MPYSHNSDHNWGFLLCQKEGLDVFASLHRLLLTGTNPMPLAKGFQMTRTEYSAALFPVSDSSVLLMLCCWHGTLVTLSHQCEVYGKIMLDKMNILKQFQNSADKFEMSLKIRAFVFHHFTKMYITLNSQHLIFRRNSAISYAWAVGFQVSLAKFILEQWRESLYHAFCWLSSITFYGAGNFWQKSNGTKQLAGSNFRFHRCSGSE